MRYARHVMLEEIGAAGQARLEAAPIALSGVPAAVATATTYLERAGVPLAASGRRVDVPDVRAGRPELEPAAAFVAGAWAAVEVIKAGVGAGSPARASCIELTGPKDDA